MYDPFQGYIRTLDWSVFTFKQGGLSTNITVQTLDNSKKGVYFMRLMGRFTPNTVFQAVSNFQVTILDQCFKTKILSS